LLSVMFVVIAFFIIFNTIRASIYTQRMEISIKKLVGASNWFVRGPYIVESLFFSILSVLITYSAVLVFSGLIDPYMHVVFGDVSILTNYFKSNIIVFAGLQFAAVFVLTIVSSALAMRKHLRA
jgi:cell division transport system permease protein